MTSFPARLAKAAADVEACLTALLACAQTPERLLAAMTHGVLAGGKRLRPFLVSEVAALLHGRAESALRAGAALECIHCYSLIHDDLPAMDNDDTRRGKPTVHRAFDEATAILAGDALLTLAFDIIADPRTEPDGDIRAALVSALARAAGARGMVGGQMLDLAAEGRFQRHRAPPSEAGITRLQAMKTGALIRVACEMGCLIGRASPEQTDTLLRYGDVIGLAFQIADDLIDLEGDPALAGKATGKDAALGKATLPSLHGAGWARAELHRLVGEADALLVPFAREADILRETARFIAFRSA